MTKDLEETLKELGDGYRPVVERLNTAYAPVPGACGFGRLCAAPPDGAKMEVSASRGGGGVRAAYGSGRRVPRRKRGGECLHGAGGGRRARILSGDRPRRQGRSGDDPHPASGRWLGERLPHSPERRGAAALSRRKGSDRLSPGRAQSATAPALNRFQIAFSDRMNGIRVFATTSAFMRCPPWNTRDIPG